MIFFKKINTSKAKIECENETKKIEIQKKIDNQLNKHKDTERSSSNTSESSTST